MEKHNENGSSKIVFYFFCIFLALITTISFCNNPVNSNALVSQNQINSDFILTRLFEYFSKVLNGYGIVWGILFVFLFNFYIRNIKLLANRKCISFWSSAVLAILMLIGRSFKAVGSWDLIFNSKFLLFESFIFFIGYFVLFEVLICIIFDFFSSGLITQCKFNKNNKVIYLLNEHPFFFSWIILILFWLPYIFSFFPGSVSGDAFVQLNQFFVYHSYSDHHPWISSLFLSTCVFLGRHIGSDNFGMFLYTIIQALFFSASFACSIKLMFKLHISDWFIFISLAFYALLPIFPGYSQYVGKDTLFAAFFIFYIISLIELIIDASKVKSKIFLCGFIVNNLLLCLMRHNGFYIWFLSVFFILFKIKNYRDKLRIIFSILVVLILFGGYTYVLLPMINVSPGSKAEALSIPFQQTARYAKYHGNEVTQEEKNAINKVLDFDQIKASYDPEVSDAVKGTYKEACTPDDMKAYLSVWWQQFLRHPGTYLQATINNSYGYFYPDVKDIWRFGTGIFSDSRYNWGQYDFSNLKGLEQYRSLIISWVNFFDNVPLMSLLDSPGIYTWILILLLGFIINERIYVKLIPLIPCLWVLLTCAASPVDRFSRYYLPVMSTVLMLIAFICSSDFNNHKAGYKNVFIDRQ